MKNPASTQVAINQTIANRWSGRAFEAAKPVSKEQILSLCEAARWAAMLMLGKKPLIA
jgi:nitroreductase